jgi:hypothetical protein
MIAATISIIKMDAEETKLIMIHHGPIEPFKLHPGGMISGRKATKIIIYL